MDCLFLPEKKADPVVQLSDSDIVRAIRQGQESAFEQLFRTYYERLCRYADTLLKDADGVAWLQGLRLPCAWVDVHGASGGSLLSPPPA